MHYSIEHIIADPLAEPTRRGLPLEKGELSTNLPNLCCVHYLRTAMKTMGFTYLFQQIQLFFYDILK